MIRLAAILSLNDVLRLLQLTTMPARQYRKHILDASGKLLFTGTADDVWQWLRATGRVGESSVNRETAGAQ